MAADPLMRHRKRLFVAPLQQTPLSGLCILGCIVEMRLRRSSFKAKHKADFLFRMRQSPCLTAHTLTYKNHTHRSKDAGTYLRETRVILALTSTVLLLPVLSYTSCWPVGRKSSICKSRGRFQLYRMTKIKNSFSYRGLSFA